VIYHSSCRGPHENQWPSASTRDSQLELTKLTEAMVLGLIVLIRTFLSFSVEIEIDGMAPWRRRSPQRQPVTTTVFLPECLAS